MERGPSHPVLVGGWRRSCGCDLWPRSVWRRRVAPLLVIGPLIIACVPSSQKSAESKSEDPPVNDTSPLDVSPDICPTTSGDESTLKIQPILPSADGEEVDGGVPTESSPTTVPQPVDVSVPEQTLGRAAAIEAARAYLLARTMSRIRLLEQLDFDGFSSADSEYAIAILNPDWNEEALQSAAGHILVGAFSRIALLYQLDFEGFTVAQAEYGIDTLNPDWNEEAFQTAQRYLQISEFTRDELVNQLLYEGFTRDEAQYGVSAAGR